MPSEQEQSVEITYADRDLAADIWRDYVAKVGEIMVERSMRSGEMDDSLPTILARHRLRGSDAVNADKALAEAWWLGGWSHDLDAMPNGVAEVAFDEGLGSCSVHVCSRYIASPTLVNGYPVPRSEWQYGYNDCELREVNTHNRRAYAWRPIPVPPPRESWPDQKSADMDAERFIAYYGAAHVRSYIARKIALTTPAPDKALMPWTPIATLPDDGERILLMWDDSDQLEAHVELGWIKRGVAFNTYGKPFSGLPTDWMHLPKRTPTPDAVNADKALAEVTAWMVVAPEGRYAFPTKLDKALTQDEIARGWMQIPLYATPAPDKTLAKPFQDRVQPWLMACFGEMIAGDREERNHRFLEEALELVQSLGCSASEAHQLVDYVYGRDVGDPPQEVGGVMVTLAALCLANKLDMHANGETELARIWTKVEAIRAKQAAKPKHSPLPQHTTPAPDKALMPEAAFGEWEPKPCPFCGQNLSKHEGTWFHPLEPRACPGRVNGLMPADDDRKALWNARTPAPVEEPKKGATGDLVAHIRLMQEACANYLEPTIYRARFPKESIRWEMEFPEPVQGQSDSGRMNTAHRRDQAFISDMIRFLDGPEERLALAATNAGQVERATDLEAALNLALSWLIKQEPGDSRAASDEFVSMAAVLANLSDLVSAREIIVSALKANGDAS